MRQFALAVCSCVFLFAALAYSQQIDVMIGGSTLETGSVPSSLATFHGPIEKNGIYPSISVDYVGWRKTRLGLNFETAWRYKTTDYPYNGETYRPIFNDVNVFFQPRFGKLFHRQVGLDLWAGIGAATTVFDVPYISSCTLVSGCVTYPTSTHFMEDFGGGVRYRVWRKFFVRPEAHYYHIQNNFQFNSNNVFRIGASFGYSFGH